jgi:uncharacterized protein YfdQ (DUF2303 family)
MTDELKDQMGLAAAISLLSHHQHGDVMLGPTLEGDAKVPLAVLSNGVRIESLKPVLDSYLPTPERATGFDEAHDRDSFVAHVLRHKQPHSVIFATLKAPSTAIFRAIFDYHDAQTGGRDGKPRHAEHGVTYPAELSEEFLAWSRFASAGYVSPVDFAEFIEARITDVVPAPTESASLASLAELLGGSWAAPIKLIELSRGLQVNVAETVKQAASLSSGEIQITYEAKHQDSAGSPLKVPSLFAIGIPIFRGGDRYQIAVRLRYRIREGRLTWAIAPHRMDASWEHASNELVTAIAAATELPVYRGKAVKG